MYNWLGNIDFIFSVSAFYYILSAIAALAFTLWIYRRTNPIVSKSTRVILILLRSIALFLVLLVLFKTIVHLQFRKTQKPVLALAIDRSASLSLSDPHGSREKLLQKSLKDPLYEDLKKNFELRYFSFANTLSNLEPDKLDSLQASGDVTNITENLKRIKTRLGREPLNGILLFSDGSYNKGGNPARFAGEIGVPVHSIGIGSDEPVTDLALIDVETEPFSYVGEKTQVQITVRSTGFEPITVPVQLRSSGRILAVQNVDLAAGPSEKTIALEFTPDKPGQMKMDFVIPSRENEQTNANNARTGYIDILKSKLPISLFAGRLSPDISFMRRYLSTSDRYDVQVFIENPNGSYDNTPAGSRLEETDIFIFYNYPTNRTRSSLLQNIHASVEKRQSSILAVIGNDTGLQKLGSFSANLPLKINGRHIQTQRVLADLSPAGFHHPITNLAGQATDRQSVWTDLPPVFASYRAAEPWPDASVLVTARPERGQSENQFPLIVVRSQNGKSAAILAEDLWRWDLMMRGSGYDEQVFQRVFNNMIRWLETGRSQRLVRVQTEKNIYNYGDDIRFDIQVFNENLEPVENADVSVSLSNKSGKKAYKASSKEIGRYELNVRPDQPGDYRAVVEARLQSAVIGSDTTQFSVGEYSAELTAIRAEKEVLKALSNATGGHYVSADSVFRLANILHGEPQQQHITLEKELWNSRVILLLIVLLLAAEWYLRKRKGMV